MHGLSMLCLCLWGYIYKMCIITTEEKINMREKTKYMSGRSWREKRDEGINMYYIQIAKKKLL